MTANPPSTPTSTPPSPTSPTRCAQSCREWFDVMLNGSTTPPRRQPRDQQTIRLYLRWAMPALTTWADQGHTSLREITTSDVRAVLPPSGNPRSTMGAGLRSILTLLKARKVLFVNPIARIQHRQPRTTRPAARARREDPRIAALAQPRLRRPDRAGHLPRPARRRTSQHAPDRPRRRPTPASASEASSSPNPSESGSPPGSTTATALAHHRQPARLPQPPQLQPHRACRRTMAHPGHRHPRPRHARRPHPPRGPRHRRRRPPHLRPVRPHRRRSPALPARTRASTTSVARAPTSRRQFANSRPQQASCERLKHVSSHR